MPDDERRDGDAAIGILMLETEFERFVGDVGNVATWRFPVVLRTVQGARPEIVTALDDDALLEPFVEAGRALAGEGVAGITTSCGFLSIYQRELARRLPVPVATSALLQVPVVERLLPPRQRAGVITFNERTLGARHLTGAGCPIDTPVAGLLDGGRFQRAVLGERSLDGFEVREADAVEAAERLCTTPGVEIGAIVLECTNLPPHAKAVARATRRPVHHVISLLHERWRALEANP